jgi:hypothetical protein
MAKIVVSALIGAVVCGILGSLAFFLLTIFDGNQPIEAFGFSLVVGFIGAFVGMLIGLAIGVGNLGALGGGISGLLATLLVVALYVVSIGSAGRYGYFLRESSIIFVVLALPTIVAGILTALLKNMLYRA